MASALIILDYNVLFAIINNKFKFILHSKKGLSNQKLVIFSRIKKFHFLFCVELRNGHIFIALTALLMKWKEMRQLINLIKKKFLETNKTKNLYKICL